MSRFVCTLLVALSACSSEMPADGDAGMGADAQDADAAEPVLGLRATYYSDYLDLILDRIEPAIDHDWGEGPPFVDASIDRFSARWTGWLIAPETATYTIAIDSDDGVRLWIGDALLIDDWRGHYVTRNEVVVELRAGEPVPLRLDYFELDLAASVRLSWSRPGVAEAVIAAEYLRADLGELTLSSPKPNYTNPVHGSDCPDPGVIAAEGAFYMVCTGGSFPIRTSRSLLSWTNSGAVILPGGKAAWSANGGRNWAPELHRVGTDYVAYFTAVDGTNRLSIGAARASSPLGPYVDKGGPLVTSAQGVIDATFFEDASGDRWLFYKIDGNATGQPTPMYVRKLAADGMSFAPGSSQTQVLVNDLGWEGGVVEAPWIIWRDGYFYMFYSGNVYDHRYRTGVARATSITGPYEKKGAPSFNRSSRALRSQNVPKTRAAHVVVRHRP
jgi:GH43 family beta-xylosidase